ncbi:hypothetical protein NRB56_10990 [Nocardia sp. RB56]|uniref:Low molecular weight antigen MTB12-like C-terminal domain-containing protein n=1 Tax=Nocardia aurantia TaxID=2585199 RepID=A0A7K0DJY7_9NOCA|nr:hypothetical protein [Nocardia aurantia]
MRSAAIGWCCHGTELNQLERKGRALKLQRTGRVAVATLAVAAALGMSACGSGDKHSDSSSTSSKASTSANAAVAPTSALPPVPTAAQLNQELSEALDPNVPADQKVQYLEDGQDALAKDPDMLKKLTDAYQQNNAHIEVTDVTSLGDTLTATVSFSVGGGAPQPAQVPFIAQDGKWKLQKSWACAGLQNLGATSPACT